MNRDGRVVFVTVGSTRFDALVACVLSKDIVQRLIANGFEKMVVQTGNSVQPIGGELKEDWDGTSRGDLFGLTVECWAFKPNLREEYERAALVIGHAGEDAFINRNQDFLSYVMYLACVWG